MLLTPLAIIAGLVAGLVRGGQPNNLRTMGLHWAPLLVVGLVLQTAGDQFSWGGGATVLLLGSFLLIIALGRNLHLRGMTIVSVGLLLNLTVLVFNGHVPTRLSALIKAQKVRDATGNVLEDIDPDLVERIGQVGQLETSETTLPILGDIIPIPLVNEVVSFGDLIMIAGLFVLFMNLLLLPRRTGVSIDEILGDETIPPSETVPPDTIDLTEPEMAPSPSATPLEVDVLGIDDPATLDHESVDQLETEGVRILPHTPDLDLTKRPSFEAALRVPPFAIRNENDET